MPLPFGQFSTGIGNTDAGFVMGTRKTLLKVCPWFLLLPDKFLKSVLENEKKKKRRNTGYMEIKLYLYISSIGEESNQKYLFNRTQNSRQMGISKILLLITLTCISL